MHFTQPGNPTCILSQTQNGGKICTLHCKMHILGSRASPQKMHIFQSMHFLYPMISSKIGILQCKMHILGSRASPQKMHISEILLFLKVFRGGTRKICILHRNANFGLPRLDSKMHSKNACFFGSLQLGQRLSDLVKPGPTRC